MDHRLYLAQRLSALIMAPLTLAHIGLMIYAVQGGLSAAEILGRTQGSLAWFLFYGLFVLAVSIHAAIGLRTILREMTSLPASFINGLSWVILIALLTTGGRAVLAVTFAVAMP